MKQAEQGRVYLQAVYVGHRPKIKRGSQQISVLKDDIYGYIVELENGRAYAYPTLQELRKYWKKANTVAGK